MTALEDVTDQGVGRRGAVGVRGGRRSRTGGGVRGGIFLFPFLFFND